MVDGMDWWSLIPRPLRRLPVDLGAIILFVIATDIVVFAPIISETPLRVVLGLPLVLFVPGYAFIAVLFPQRHHPVRDADAVRTERRDSGDWNGTLNTGIDGIERTVLSFTLSVGISLLIGLILNFSPLGIRVVPVTLSSSAFTLITTVVATVRRWQLPANERFRVPYRKWYTALFEDVLNHETRTDTALTILLVISLLLAASTVAYAAVVPKQDGSFTELYLLTENDSGDLVAADYPRNFTVGKSELLVVGIDNHEHRPMKYTAIVELQRVRSENGSTHVLEETTLDRFTVSLRSGEVWRERRAVKPTLTGRLRLTYLLYRGNPPNDPSTKTAYRETYLWITVTDSARRLPRSRFRP